jgi:predicted Zn-dependent protease
MHRALILVSFAALFANAQERGPVNLYSPQREGELGAQLAAQVRSQSTVIGDATINRYVTRVGDKLSAVLPDRHKVHVRSRG